MQEIKFRAWDKKEKKMYGPQDQYIRGLVVLLGGFTKYGGCIDYSSEPCFDSFQWYNKEIIEARYILMQYTGLKDKNGNDLDWWEGDLFKVQGRQDLFEIIEDGACFWFRNRITRERFACYKATIWANLPKKVGNKWESPELLEKE